MRVITALKPDERRAAHPEPAARGEGYVSRTDAEGRFALPAKPSEEQEVILLKPGFEVGVAPASAFANAEKQAVEFTLTRGFEIEGSVRDSGGRALAHARISSTTSSPNGRLVRYTVESTEEGLFRFRYGTARREVSRDPKQEPPAYEIRLQRKQDAIALGGRVVGAEQATLEVRVPRPSTWIDSGDKSLPLLLTLAVDATGAFAFRGLPDGTYRLTASARGAAEYSAEVVAPRKDLRIELAPGGSIRVQVEPAGVWWVHLEQPGGRSHWSKQTDRQGRVDPRGTRAARAGGPLGQAACGSAGRALSGTGLRRV